MENLISKSTSGIISTQEIFAENISREILNKFIENLEDVSIVEKSPKLEGRNMFTILAKKTEK